MPKTNLGKGKTNGKPATERFNDVVFISFPLDVEQKQAIKALQWQIEDYDTTLINLNDAGYKVSLNYDEYNDAYACFITPGKNHPTNSGFILTGRGSTPLKALKQAAYVHHVLFDGDWSAWRDTRRNDIIDD